MKKQIINSHHTRKSLWLLASGSKFTMLNNKGLYNDLLNYPNYPSYFDKSIQQDLHRTVNIQTSSTEIQDLQKLRKILKAFSRRNPFVGYCQGLNFIAFFLLTMQFTEQECFWLLNQIIETIIPMDYYTNMIGVVCDQQIFISVLKHLKPHMVQKFDEVGLDSSMISIQWFVCLFTSSLPFYLAKIVWDRILVEGPKIFIKTGIIILSQFQQKIMQVEEFHQIITILEGTKNLKIPEIQFNAEFQKIYIDERVLHVARDLYREYYLKEKLAQKIQKQTKKKEVIHCQSKWPICFQKLLQSKQQIQNIDVWTYRQQIAPKLIHDYLDGKQKRKKTYTMSVLTQNSKNKKLTNQKKKIQNQNINNKKKDQFQTLKRFQTEFNIPIQKFDELKQNQKYQQKKYSELLIGRMKHICITNTNEIEQKKKKRKNDLKFTSMIIQGNENNQDNELKKKNLKKIFNVTPNNNQQKFEKSQTIDFYKKFLYDNKEISQIFIPNFNGEQIQFDSDKNNN